ncbi:Uncharacterised protein [Mycolicibacterium gilvum]|uniref:Uncharacterized protein n=1 Tax=Mycolicibacterium gilvum TaxID=1804 RepID=A0A379MQ81_9MYCO|nr:Uncharacterised protein [Mycolicibacterium gilvum]
MLHLCVFRVRRGPAGAVWARGWRPGPGPLRPAPGPGGSPWCEHRCDHLATAGTSWMWVTVQVASPVMVASNRNADSASPQRSTLSRESSSVESTTMAASSDSSSPRRSGCVVTGNVRPIPTRSPSAAETSALRGNSLGGDEISCPPEQFGVVVGVVEPQHLRQLGGLDQHVALVARYRVHSHRIVRLRTGRSGFAGYVPVPRRAERQTVCAAHQDRIGRRFCSAVTSVAVANLILAM